MIKEQEDGMSTSEAYRRHGPGPASVYKFQAKYGGIDTSDTHRIKLLEDKNSKLKRLLADMMLNNVVLKNFSEKLTATSVQRAADHKAMLCQHISQRRTGKLVPSHTCKHVLPGNGCRSEDHPVRQTTR